MEPVKRTLTKAALPDFCFEKASLRLLSHFNHALVVLQRLLQGRFGGLRVLSHFDVRHREVTAEVRVELHLDVFLAGHRGQHAWRLLGLVDRLGRAVLRIMPLLLAQKTCLVLNCVQVHGVAVQLRVQLLLRDLLLLAESGLMPLLSAAMANDQLVALHLVGSVLFRVMILFVLPVVIAVKVRYHTQCEILGGDGVPDVGVHAEGSIWAKPKHVVAADLERVIMPKQTWSGAQVVAQLAKSLVIVGTTLLFL